MLKQDFLADPASQHIFSIYHLPRISLPRYDSRNAADTVGVNGVYVPVECILIIRGGIFEAVIQSTCVREIFTLFVMSVCRRFVVDDCASPLYTYFRLFNPFRFFEPLNIKRQRYCRPQLSRLFAKDDKSASLEANLYKRRVRKENHHYLTRGERKM